MAKILEKRGHMGIFQRFQKKGNKKEKKQEQRSAPEQKPEEQPEQQGIPSFLMVIPRNEEDIQDPKAIIDRLMAALAADPTVELCGTDWDEEEGIPLMDLLYREEQYRVAFFLDGFQLNGLYRLCHDIPQEDLEAMEDTAGMVVRVHFHENVQAGLHLQLKVADALVPNALAAVDFSRERVLSPVWLHMAAESAVDPALSYLFSIQAVSDGEGCPVWLHSHGLYRCGHFELEALNVPQEKVGMVGEILNSMAETVLDRGGYPEEDQPIALAKLASGDPLLVSWRRWENCMEEYPASTLGVGESRDEGHRGPSGVFSFYDSIEDAQAGRRRPLGELDPERYQHPMYNLTTEETDRMQALAVERLDWLRRGFALGGEVKAIVKMGLDQDPEREGEDDFYNGKEHIWFVLQELKADTLVGELINAPYFISGLHEGDRLEVGLDRLTDWRLYLNDRQIGPDDVYLLADMLK